MTKVSLVFSLSPYFSFSSSLFSHAVCLTALFFCTVYLLSFSTQSPFTLPLFSLCVFLTAVALISGAVAAFLFFHWRKSMLIYLLCPFWIVNWIVVVLSDLTNRPQFKEYRSLTSAVIHIVFENKTWPIRCNLLNCQWIWYDIMCVLDWKSVMHLKVRMQFVLIAGAIWKLEEWSFLYKDSLLLNLLKY